MRKPKLEVNEAEAIIPRQGMTLLLHALDSLRDKLTKGGKSAATARETKALAVVRAMRTAQKKRPADDGEELPPAKQVAGSDAAVAAASATTGTNDL